MPILDEFYDSAAKLYYGKDPILIENYKLQSCLNFDDGQQKTYISITLECSIQKKGSKESGGVSFNDIKYWHDRHQSEINPEQNSDARNRPLQQPRAGSFVTEQMFREELGREKSHEMAAEVNAARVQTDGTKMSRISMCFEFNLGSRAGKEALGKLYHKFSQLGELYPKFSQFRERIEAELDRIAQQDLEGYFAVYRAMAESYRGEFYPGYGQIMMINCDHLYTGKATVISIGQTGAHMRSIDAYRAGEHVEIDKGGELAFVFKEEEGPKLKSFKEQLFHPCKIPWRRSKLGRHLLYIKYPIKQIDPNDRGWDYTPRHENYIGTDLDFISGIQEIALENARRRLALAIVANLSKDILMSMDILMTIVEKVQRHLILPRETGGELKTVNCVENEAKHAKVAITWKNGRGRVDEGEAYIKAIELREGRVKEHDVSQLLLGELTQKVRDGVEFFNAMTSSDLRNRDSGQMQRALELELHELEFDLNERSGLEEQVAKILEPFHTARDKKMDEMFEAQRAAAEPEAQAAEPEAQAVEPATPSPRPR